MKVITLAAMMVLAGRGVSAQPLIEWTRISRSTLVTGSASDPCFPDPPDQSRSNLNALVTSDYAVVDTVVNIEIPLNSGYGLSAGANGSTEIFQSALSAVVQSSGFASSGFVSEETCTGNTSLNTTANVSLDGAFRINRRAVLVTGRARTSNVTFYHGHNHLGPNGATQTHAQLLVAGPGGFRVSYELGRTYNSLGTVSQTLDAPLGEYSVVEPGVYTLLMSARSSAQAAGGTLASAGIIGNMRFQALDLVCPSIELDPVDATLVLTPPSPAVQFSLRLVTSTSPLSIETSPPTPLAIIQWYKAGSTSPLTDGPTAWGSIISGSRAEANTASTLYIENPTELDAGVYYAAVTSPCGSIVSGTARLATDPAGACQPPEILTQPLTPLACNGATARFSVIALARTTDGAVAYQWRRNLVPLVNGSTPLASTIYGATSATLEIALPRPAASGAYDCVITNACGSATTIPVTLTICPADFNCSGLLSVQDIFDFLAAYFANDSAADFNGAGSLTVQDIFDFLAAYFTGCP